MGKKYEIITCNGKRKIKGFKEKLSIEEKEKTTGMDEYFTKKFKFKTYNIKDNDSIEKDDFNKQWEGYYINSKNEKINIFIYCIKISDLADMRKWIGKDKWIRRANFDPTMFKDYLIGVLNPNITIDKIKSKLKDKITRFQLMDI